ncbi:Hypothetical predicted protein [Paramuricea clavata]|uniref:Uncharacterized protein n=1 Tax=Paramuricea clavata TaxID=317549 RepID=A0A7D9L8N5_PARCT|nr:Hypothetical predicted protein [Paramuricea clavata]
MLETNEQLEKAKNIRRAAKGKITRVIRTAKEIKDSYAALIVKYEEYAIFLNDEEIDEAETCLNECSNEYTQLSIVINDYIKLKTSQTKVKEEVSAASIEINNQPSTQPSSDNVFSSESQSTATGNTGEIDVPPITMPSKSLYVKHEKPILPTFYGDVRKYFIFKSDFQHAIEHYRSERDAIAFLRSSLGPEPAILIERITTDLKTAWKYLEHNYGDLRIISDTISADLEKFKPLQSHDDQPVIWSTLFQSRTSC